MYLQFGGTWSGQISLRPHTTKKPQNVAEVLGDLRQFQGIQVGEILQFGHTWSTPIAWIYTLYMACFICSRPKKNRWWFQIFFFNALTWGNDPIWRAYVSSMGWFDHQPENGCKLNEVVIYDLHDADFEELELGKPSSNTGKKGLRKKRQSPKVWFKNPDYPELFYIFFIYWWCFTLVGWGSFLVWLIVLSIQMGRKHQVVSHDSKHDVLFRQWKSKTIKRIVPWNWWWTLTKTVVFMETSIEHIFFKGIWVFPKIGVPPNHPF